MKKKDRLANSVLIVLTIGAVGFTLIVGPFAWLLALVTEEIRGGHNWLPAVAGVAFAAGFAATRIVEDSFDSIFGRAPFAQIGEDVPAGQEKHPRWVDSMLAPMGYTLFLGRVAAIVGALALFSYAVYAVIHLAVTTLRT